MNFQQVSETQFVIPIPDIDHVNHLVVFMTGQIPFPENFGGGGKYFQRIILLIIREKTFLSVYFSWPSTEGPSWIFLGKISNQKPSAIFRMNKLKGIFRCTEMKLC